MKARHWHRQANGVVQCDLCPHHCRIKAGGTGRCRVRRVEGEALVAAGYGLLSAANMDPIEKKPLYHFRPGTQIFSVGAWGCNLRCSFCQNWQISQQVKEGCRAASPERVVAQAVGMGSQGIAYTYNEPLVGFEFVVDCAELAASEGLSNVLVTNGFIERGPAAEVLGLSDALNVDIKSMDEDFYRRQCTGRLRPVLEFAVQAREAGCHVEVTNLLIPGLNDTEEKVARLALWVAEKLGRQTPLHLSAYHPDYRLEVPGTPLGALERAYAVCSDELDYVYLGNVGPMQVGRDTRCPGCGAVLVRRRGYATSVVGLRNGVCASCGRKADFSLAPA